MAGKEILLWKRKHYIDFSYAGELLHLVLLTHRLDITNQFSYHFPQILYIPRQSTKIASINQSEIRNDDLTEMTQGLRSLAAIIDDLGSVPGMHIVGNSRL